MIMNVLWERLSETGSNWRYVYKVINQLFFFCFSVFSSSLTLMFNLVFQALTVIEYLLANGSERTVDDIIEHSFQISV